MKVLIVNTSEKTGGAALAAKRLMEALNNNGVKAKMLVRDKETEQITVVPLPSKLMQQWHFLWDRFKIYCHLWFSKNHLFDIDTASSGADITKLPEFKEAEIIHLHWVNQGMLSLKGIKKILDSGKPVVWTMHDVWPATAICHLTLDCRKFENRCHHCRLLPNGGSDNDLSAKVWKRKRKLLENNRISFVACSKWLAGEAKKSELLSGQSITNIPNPIDMRVFKPGDKQEGRVANNLPAGKRIILFVSQRATNVNKGMDYLVEACRLLAEQYPEMKENTAVAVLGGHADEVIEQLPFEAIPLGYVSDTKRIVELYHAADVFVLPSLSENLPNTTMEALACGVPCVGFKVGGIPEMIDHKKNGYVANYRDAKDLANGIRWVLDEANGEELTKNALHKVHANYSQTAVAMQYIEVYNHAAAFKNYKI